MSLTITKHFAQKDPPVLDLHGPMRFAIFKRNIPREILVHRDVSVKPELDEAAPMGFGFSAHHELSPNAAPLHRWCDRDGIDEHMVLVPYEDEDARDRAGDLKHINEVVLDPSNMIVA